MVNPRSRARSRQNRGKEGRSRAGGRDRYAGELEACKGEQSEAARLVALECLERLDRAKARTTTLAGWQKGECPLSASQAQNATERYLACRRESMLGNALTVAICGVVLRSCRKLGCLSRLSFPYIFSFCEAKHTPLLDVLCASQLQPSLFYETPDSWYVQHAANQLRARASLSSMSCRSAAPCSFLVGAAIGWLWSLESGIASSTVQH